MKSWIFILYLGNNPILFYLPLAQIAPALTIGQSFIWLLFSFDMTYHCVCVCVCVCVWFVFFSNFLITVTTEYFGYILNACYPTSRTSHFSFYWRMVLEAKIGVLGVLIAAGVSLLLGPLSWQNKELYMCILAYMCAYIYKYFFM